MTKLEKEYLSCSVDPLNCAFSLLKIYNFYYKIAIV